MASAPLILIAYGIGAYFFATPDDSLLLTPVAISAAAVSAMIEYFVWKDRQLPILDVGALCALITLLYCAVPILAFIKSGYAWSSLSDARLQQMQPGADELSAWAWSVAAYLLAFCAVYGITRGPGMPGPTVRVASDAADGKALLIILAACLAYAAAFSWYFDTNLQPSNQELASGEWMKDIPLLAAQTIHNVLGLLRIAVFGLIAFVTARRDLRWIIALAALTVFAAYVAVSNSGPRTDVVMLMFCALLCWHRLIRPIGFAKALTMGIVMLSGVILFGYWRDVGGDVQYMDLSTASTEFQTILANGVHVAWAKAHDILKDVSWDVTFNDLILLIPQQLLPFQKMDLPTWYVRNAHVNANGTGLMFGVVAQSALGYGLPEIILRGAVLGLLLALIHRQCARRAESLTAVIVYLWLCISIYYTFRASTFYPATWAFYRLLPFVLCFWALRALLRSKGRSAFATTC
ncbi:hypothetical protein ACFFWD_22775 [Bradyrhizobium erythrophlei]|uniref:hypothetical protein n=1 Tax=Bradyrhizobium erythrophlei TaxID=1437360 RepID=UPI0035ECEE16